MLGPVCEGLPGRYSFGEVRGDGFVVAAGEGDEALQLLDGEGAGRVVVVGGVAESSDDVEAEEFVVGEVGREGDDP